MTTGGGLLLVLEERAESTVATVTGTLTSAGYPELRDTVLKVATEAPECVIADIRGLDIGDDTAMTVFSVIAGRISRWPGIPFAVVTDREDHLTAMAAQRRFPVFADVPTAERARDHPPRLRAVQLLTASPNASAVSREFVSRVCAAWNAPGFVDDASVIATELVENAIRHTTSNPRLRLELCRGVFTVAVADNDPRPAVLRERPHHRQHGVGLMLVAQTARHWGYSRSRAGGKVVWAVLARRGRFELGTAR
ncbi:ATP-binding protein [Amycolatopsis sp. cg9]|uniref:ATP-binding protein n=1 Tax=Amycolatopsis sp. cg9 TaxID=3238801 RepID=UPI0035235A4A